MRSGSWALAAALLLAAACGGGGGTTTGPAAPTASAPTAAPSASAMTPAPSGSVASTGTAPSVAKANTPIAASAMAADLKALGLEPGKLPPLSKMEPDKLRKVMKTFSKALGTNCAGCHDPNDFRAPTPKKKIASKMWDEYVRGLAFEDGSLLYCDSCHQGHLEVLDRRDKKALGQWMDANYVAKLKRTDKNDHDCATCHGEEMEMHLLARWTREGGAK